MAILIVFKRTVTTGGIRTCSSETYFIIDNLWLYFFQLEVSYSDVKSWMKYDLNSLLEFNSIISSLGLYSQHGFEMSQTAITILVEYDNLRGRAGLLILHDNHCGRAFSIKKFLGTTHFLVRSIPWEKWGLKSCKNQNFIFSAKSTESITVLIFPWIVEFRSLCKENWKNISSFSTVCIIIIRVLNFTTINGFRKSSNWFSWKIE